MKQEADSSNKQSLIKFEDENLGETSDSDDLYILSADFLPQIDEFFQMKQSVVLLDLQSLSTMPMVNESETDTFKVKVRTPKRPRKVFPIKETPVPEVSPALKSLIDKNLLEIFKFYCRKHLNQQGDFEQLDYQRNVLAHNGYVNFCKDFKLPVSGQHITEVFKKSAVSGHPHEYEQFNNSITNLGLRINKAKVEERKKKIQEIR